MGEHDVIESLSVQAKSPWAKTGSGEAATQWEPLYVHLFDAAEVASLIWRDYVAESTKITLATMLDLSEDEASRVVAWIAGAHDIGKATPPFQGQQRELWEKDLLAGLSPVSSRERWSHAYLGQEVLTQWMKDHGFDELTRPVASVVGGHHGAYPSTDALDKVRLLSSETLGDHTWRAVQEELLDAVAAAYLGPELAKKMAGNPVPPSVQVLLTGIAIMADWIASNTELFPLVAAVDSLAELRVRARRAWQLLGLPKAVRFTLEDLAPEALFRARFTALPKDAKLNFVQRATVNAALAMERPGLMVIEAPMGCGKTEASLLGAEILADKFGQGGIAYLLPTQATSSAMFDRVRQWMNSALHDVDVPGPQDLHLLHGKAALDEGFRSLPVWRTSSMGDGASSGNAFDDAIVAHQWFGGRKRGLLANTVVGTVDQLLMAALNARHVQLRHLGLAGKVVVVDEVHAYDAYMSVYLQQALYFLGLYQVPVILLSATLPPEKKARFIKAYEGKPARTKWKNKAETTCPVHPYPAVTVGQGLQAEPLVMPCGEDGPSRPYAIEWLDDDEELLVQELQESLAHGGCACVVRDTVVRAQRTYNLLKKRLSVPVALAHSRFVALDRAKKDAELLALLGRDGKERPSGFVVVGTQVIEQSLDIDFDLMVTDIAPVDLVLQRMGRLHRHQRGEGEDERPLGLRKPRCIITGVERWDDDVPRFARGVALEGGSGVYEKVLLYRTILALQERIETNGNLQLPADIPRLVDEVYCLEDGRIQVPEPWEQAYGEADKSYKAHVDCSEKRAESWRLKKLVRRQKVGLVGWMDNSALFPNDDVGRRAVRDGDGGVEVVLVQKVDGKLRLLPWVAADQGVDPDLVDDHGPVEEACRIAASCTVALPGWLCQKRGVIDALESRGSFLALETSPWLHGCLFVALDENGHVAMSLGEEDAAAGEGKRQSIQLLYRKDQGLEVFTVNQDEEEE